MSLSYWKTQFEKWNLLYYQNDDASHDIYHFRRVANNAFLIADQYPTENIDRYALLAASYFHDVVNLPKDHRNRSLASTYSAEKAVKILTDLGFDQKKLPIVAHAIIAHSFSANIEPATLEAKIVQDADRIDSLGVVGVLRAFYVAGRLNRLLFHETDPLAKERQLDDQRYSLDHLELKIAVMSNMLKTEAGQKIATPRIAVVKQFRDKLSEEILYKENKCHMELASTLFQAGREKKFLFHPEDPFASSRKINRGLYAMDHLLPIQGLDWLFTSLREELYQH